MDSESIISFINSLTNLLAETNLHIISYKCEAIFKTIKHANVPLHVIPCKQYYIVDEELNHVLELKLNAKKFEDVAKYRELEKELLKKKGYTQSEILKSEPSYFIFKEGCILCFLSPLGIGERLIMNLIENHNIPRTT